MKASFNLYIYAMKRKTFFCLLVISIFLPHCEKEIEWASLDISYDHVTATSVKVFGAIGKGRSYRYGFVYAPHPGPTKKDKVIDAYGNRDSLIGIIINLRPHTDYYIRLYNDGNNNETKYSDEIQITTKEQASLTDKRDNQKYAITRIGDQTWMADNLRYIPDSGSYWHYAHDSARYWQLGLLYDWETACQVCPPGWRLPSDDDWKILEREIGMPDEEIDILDLRPSPVGNKLRGLDTANWKVHLPATNETGFNAYGAGTYYQQSDAPWDHKFKACYWTSTEIESPHWQITRIMPIIRGIVYDGKIDRIELDKTTGLSVRCIQIE